MRIEPLEPPVFSLTPFEPVLAPKRPVGRPRKIPLEDNKPGPMAIDQQKRKKENDSPGEERAKIKRPVGRPRMNLAAIKNDESEPTPPNASASTGGSSNDAPTGKPPKASSTGGSSTVLPKKTIIKAPTIKGRNSPAQLAPSVIGLQRLVEAFMEAKAQDVLHYKDLSSYMILYDEYKKLAGKKELKQAKMDELRSLYKKVIYKR